MRWSDVAFSQALKLDPIDARAIRKACRTFASDESSLDRSPAVTRATEGGSEEGVYEFAVGDWVVVLVVDAGDLVIADIRRFP